MNSRHEKAKHKTLHPQVIHCLILAWNEQKRRVELLKNCCRAETENSPKPTLQLIMQYIEVRYVTYFEEQNLSPTTLLLFWQCILLKLFHFMFWENNSVCKSFGTPWRAYFCMVCSNSITIISNRGPIVFLHWQSQCFPYIYLERTSCFSHFIQFDKLVLKVDVSGVQADQLQQCAKVWASLDLFFWI